MRINTTIRKEDEKVADQVRVEVGWANFIHACFSLWLNDIRFNKEIRRFNDGRSKKD